MSDGFVLLNLLILLTVANGAPVLAGKALAFDAPIDGGWCFYDGRPLFGPSKTIRGVLVSLVATTVVAELLGWDWRIGVCISAGAMAGDLATSFVKRRLGLPAHDRATGLDQVPEAGLPLLIVQSRLGLGILDIVVVVGAFALVALLGSRALFQIGMKDRPY